MFCEIVRREAKNCEEWNSHLEVVASSISDQEVLFRSCFVLTATNSSRMGKNRAKNVDKRTLSEGRLMHTIILDFHGTCTVQTRSVQVATIGETKNVVPPVRNLDAFAVPLIDRLTFVIT